MLSRTALRAQRAARFQSRSTLHRRFASQQQSSASPSSGLGHQVTGGLIGGGLVLAGTYGWYHFSGAKTAVGAATSAKSYVDSATSNLQQQFREKTPDTNQAIQTLRETANKYASFIPGGRGYVDSAFDDLETIRRKHGGEVDKIVREAYDELRAVASKGELTLETAGKAYEVLTKHLTRLVELGKDASGDLIENHPQLKEKLGGSAEQLSQLGDKLGPEAKKQVEETWEEVRKIAQGGLSAENVEKIKKLVAEKSQRIQEFGSQAFDQGWKQIQPLLEKNPKVKEFLEKNKDAFKQGDVGQLVEKVKAAVSSGDTKDLEQYLQQVKDKAQSSFSSSQLSTWFEAIPSGGAILPQLMKLREIAQQKGGRAQELVQETIEEVKQVLDRKSGEVEKLYEEGKEQAKNQKK